MSASLGLMAYAGLVALIVPDRLRLAFWLWVLACALVVGVEAVPLAVFFFSPVVFLDTIRKAFFGG